MTHDGLNKYDGGYGVVEKIEVKACIPKTTSIHELFAICHAMYLLKEEIQFLRLKFEQ